MQEWCIIRAMRDDDFSSWGMDALRGYVIMRSEFLSGSMLDDSVKAGYAQKLENAKKQLSVLEAQVNANDPRYRYARAQLSHTGSSSISR